MKKSPSISIIVPIYNCERYLVRCLDSIFMQTIIENCEVILINDSTPDKSYAIVQEKVKQYQQYSENIVIINHEENRKIGYTRAEGIATASGEYIAQVDSDDWIEADMFEKMFNLAKESGADIVSTNLEFVYRKHTVVSTQIPADIPEEAMKQIITGKTGGFFCNKLIRKTLFTEYLLEKLMRVNMWEDAMLCIPMYYAAQRIAHVDEPLYHYDRTNVNSLCANLSENSIQQLLIVADNVEHFMADKSFDGKLVDIFKARIKAFVLPQIQSKLLRKYKSLYKEADLVLYEVDTIPVYNKMLIRLLNVNLYLGMIYNSCLKFLKKIKANFL